jgi:hypothetical protein
MESVRRLAWNRWLLPVWVSFSGDLYTVRSATGTGGPIHVHSRRRVEPNLSTAESAERLWFKHAREEVKIAEAERRARRERRRVRTTV